ncbi:hypothetical protein SUDANB15_07616 (plasmid) [Streptomyces sp. enrichment culture]
MALSQHDLLRLLESLRSADGLELVRHVAERMLQELIEAEATARIGAEWNEHTETRTALRNGHRDKTLTTQAGDLDLAIPKLRSGSFFPALLERRRRIDQALYAVIMEAYVHGVSTRSVDDLVKALGADTGVSKSEVSRICQDLDGQLTAFRARPLDHVRFPYVYLDATYCKARVEHQIVSRAVVIATGITEEGGREVLGVMVGDSETEVFWTQFLRSLRERGLTGVRLVIGDHHLGLVKAIRKVMLGAAYQRCRVHFLRNVFSVINKEAAEMAAATIRTIFAQDGVPPGGVGDQGAEIRRPGTVAPPSRGLTPPHQQASWAAVSTEIAMGLVPERVALDPLHHVVGHDPGALAAFTAREVAQRIRDERRASACRLLMRSEEAEAEAVYDMMLRLPCGHQAAEEAAGTQAKQSHDVYHLQGCTKGIYTVTTPSYFQFWD